MADMGFGLSRDDVMHTAYKIVEATGRLGGLGLMVLGLVILT